jgi:hypothetical protein
LTQRATCALQNPSLRAERTQPVTMQASGCDWPRAVSAAWRTQPSIGGDPAVRHIRT